MAASDLPCAALLPEMYGMPPFADDGDEPDGPRDPELFAQAYAADASADRDLAVVRNERLLAALAIVPSMLDEPYRSLHVDQPWSGRLATHLLARARRQGLRLRSDVDGHLGVATVPSTRRP